MPNPIVQTARTLGAPVLVTGAVLCAMLVWSTLTNARPAASPEYLAEVRERVRALPYAIGPMVGTDIEVVAAAAEMLNPNVILQRVYRDPLSGNLVSLVIVHCQDVRDLAGHYPPVCYPNAGWSERRDRELREIELDDARVSATRYHFARKNEMSEDSITVTSFFVLPASDLSFAPDMVAVDLAARSPKMAGLGAAHIMMITPDTQPADVSQRLVMDVANALRPILRSITEPPSSDTTTSKSDRSGTSAVPAPPRPSALAALTVPSRSTFASLAFSRDQEPRP
jgi:hypothetical protein